MAIGIGTGNHYSIVLKDGVIYTVGENTNSQLARGNGTEPELTTFEPIMMPLGFNGTIASISAGQLHGAFLTTNGEVYTWGDGNLGKLGNGSTANVDILTPIKVAALDGIEVSSVLMGNGASYAITTDGVLYAWGQNTNGQLGIGNTTSQGTPVAISAASFGGERVADVSTGTSFTLVLTDGGEVYAMGGNVQQQTGPNGSGRSVSTPVHVDVPGTVVSIEAGTNTAIVLTADGRVYGWGQSDFGQLVKGTIEPDGSLSGSAAPSSATPTLIQGLPTNISEVHVGSRWVVAITSDGEVWTWGDQGWLDSTRESIVRAPYQITDFDGIEIVDVVSGPNHALFVSADGQVYGLGATADGRLGFLQADADRASAPVLIAVPRDTVQVVVDGADDQTTGSLNAAGTLEAGKESFHFYGFDGDDTILGSNGGDILEGGAGADSLVGGTGNDTLHGGSGADVMTGGAGGDVFFGTIGQLDGDTIIDFQIGDAIQVSGAGASISSVGLVGHELTISLSDGTSAALTLDQLPSGVWSFAANTVSLAAVPTPTPPSPPVGPTVGPDNLLGTNGPDTIAGGLGADTISGGLGDDVFYGNQGADILFGNQGNDTLYGGKDDDFVYGGKDDDYIEGNLGNDYVEGNLGNDLVLGNQGEDTVLGNQGNDTVHGGQGDDLVHGGQGDDLVHGDKGDDRIWGDLGNDTLSGGEGSDTFFFALNSGSDIIVDFNRAEGDQLDFQGQTYTVADVNGSVVFTLSGGGTVVLTGVSSASLDAGAFA